MLTPDHNTNTDTDKFRLLVESAIDYGIFMLDLEGHITSWNVGAERIKGYSAGEIIGKHFSIFYPQEAITARWPDQELEMAAAQGRFEDQGWRIRKDGTRFWANVVITALKGRNGEPLGFFKITRDMTSSKEVERLREEGRHIHHFLAILAHELRNPIAPIVNAVEVMKWDSSGEKTPWAREVIGRQAGQLSRLVDDLLDVQRVVSGKIQLRREALDLRDVVRDAVEETSAAFKSRQHTLSAEIPGNEVLCDGDRVRLVQAVGNLLTNAAKFTPTGGSISLCLVGHECTADIIVRDSGIGIESHMLPLIFKAFVQVDTRLERAESGLGIGLSLVKELIEQHGGSTSAASAGLGLGSEFKIELPRFNAQRSPAQTSSSPPAKAGKQSSRILIVDDSRDAAESLAMVLRAHDHAVETCFDSNEALAAVKHFRPQVAMLDLGMPGINGYELARAIRQLDEFRNITLVAATGYGRPEDKALTKAAGFDHHLVKPVDIPALLALLDGTSCAESMQPTQA